MKNDPNTLMPQLVRDLRYCSHIEEGVEMGESINLGAHVLVRPNSLLGQMCPNIPMTTFDIVIITAYKQR